MWNSGRGDGLGKEGAPVMLGFRLTANDRLLLELGNVLCGAVGKLSLGEL